MGAVATRSAGREDRVKFRVSVSKSRFAVGEPIPLSMSLRNRSANPVTVNSRFAVGDASLPNELREVVLILKGPSGQLELAVVGSVRPLGAEDFAHLGSRQAAEGSVDLAFLFDLTQPGRYTVEARYQNSSGGPIVVDPGTGAVVERELGALRITRAAKARFRVL